jgi:hypothetical protein
VGDIGTLQPGVVEQVPSDQQNVGCMSRGGGGEGMDRALAHVAVAAVGSAYVANVNIGGVQDA